ncbi:MAG: methyltransferase family protein [Desulforhopalus sp.]
MHSLLIDTRVANFLHKQFPALARYYRLLYNGLSLVTLLPLVIVTRISGGEVVVSWSAYTLPVRGLLFIASLALFYSAAKRYDLKYFLGVKQLKTGQSSLLIGPDEEFSEAGVFGLTRHPWYLGALLLIWSAPANYPLAVFFAACILSLYLLVGTILEEKKIISRYREPYRKYQQRVSMLFPWKWIKRRLLGD